MNPFHRLSSFHSLELFCQVAKDIVADHIAHQRGVKHIRSKPHRQTRLKEENVQLFWDRLDAGLITPKKFIDRMAYRVGGGTDALKYSEVKSTDLLSNTLCH